MCVRLEKDMTFTKCFCLSAEEMPALTESFREKECGFNFIFTERRTLMHSWIVFVLFSINLFIAGLRET